MPVSTAMNYADRAALRGDPDVQEQALMLEISVDELLHLDVSRAEKCSCPVVLKRTNFLTDVIDELKLPCGSSDANKCLPCSEFSQRLRMRQIMNTIEKPGVETALFTLTAPSFGKVHRASWTEKDAFSTRKLSPHDKYVARLNKLNNKKNCCPCGTAHDYEYDRLGTPLNPKEYDYAAEVVWSENLPRLMSSTKRKLRYTARKLGVTSAGEDAQLALFAVFERQKRGALHAHFLISVKNNRSGFLRLVAQIKTEWVSATAKILNELAEWYVSDEAQARLEQSNLPGSKTLLDSIPVVTWRANLFSEGEPVIGTKFGDVWDIRILDAGAQNETEVVNHKQAAAYVSKYLTKSQASFSPESIAQKGSWQAQHFGRFRSVAAALLSDKQVLDSRRSFLRREIEKAAEQGTLTGIVGEFYQTQLAHLMVTPIAPNPLVDLILADLQTETLTFPTLLEASRKTDMDQAISLRSGKLRLNKTANNAGFSGALTSSSNWDDSLASLRRGMKAYYDEHHPPELGAEEEIFTYELDFEAMENERIMRLPWLSKPDPVDA